jgi:hypothetical protein
VEIAAREAFNVEEAAMYAADLAAAVEEQGILEAARMATSHWEELCEELWGGGRATSPTNRRTAAARSATTTLFTLTMTTLTMTSSPN